MKVLWYDCTRQIGGILHGALKCISIASAPTPHCWHARGNWIYSSWVSGVVRETEALENSKESLKMAIYWLGNGPPFLAYFSASYQQLWVPVTILGLVCSEICSGNRSLKFFQICSPTLHPPVTSTYWFLVFVICASSIDEDGFLPVPSSIIHPHPGWSLESKDLTLRLKVCIVKNAHGSLHLLGTHQCTSPRCSPSHPPPILRDFDSSARDMLTLGSAPQQGPTCSWEGSPSAITTHTYQHSSSQHHRLRNLQDQFHRALVTTRSPWLPSIPHHLVSPPQRALYTLLWPSLQPLPISQPWVLWFSLSILSKILDFHLLPWIFPLPKPSSLLKTLLPLLSAQRWLFSFPKSMCPWPRDGGDILLAMFRPLSLPLP